MSGVSSRSPVVTIRRRADRGEPSSTNTSNRGLPSRSERLDPRHGAVDEMTAVAGDLIPSGGQEFGGRQAVGAQEALHVSRRGVPGLAGVDNRDVAPGAAQNQGGGQSGRPATDDRDVVLVHVTRVTGPSWRRQRSSPFLGSPRSDDHASRSGDGQPLIGERSRARDRPPPRSAGSSLRAPARGETGTKVPIGASRRALPPDGSAGEDSGQDEERRPAMRAAVVKDFTQPLEITEVPTPEPGPGEVLVRVEASGLCHTDIHAARGDWPVKPIPPFIPGHEGVGIVEARRRRCHGTGGGPAGRRPVARLRLRNVRPLHRRLGEPVRAAGQHRLRARRRVRRVPRGGRRVRAARARRHRPRRRRPADLRGRHDLQGGQGLRPAARPSAPRSSASAAWDTWRCSTPGSSAATRSLSTSRRRSCGSPRSSARPPS